MSEDKKKWVVGGIALIAVLTTVAVFQSRPDSGGGDSIGAGPVSKPKSVEQQIKDVEANPNIPPSQKATIIAAIRMNSGQQATAGAPQIGIATSKP
ncbi:MAG: hypothetical protein H8F28_20365 [Fibrella sp.]|nr:hypothetical protein [Armatimonadota bacterium]